MVECEKCDSWYHPECIGIFEKDDVKLNMMYILCKQCRAKHKTAANTNGHINNPIPEICSQEMLLKLENKQVQQQKIIPFKSKIEPSFDAKLDPKLEPKIEGKLNTNPDKGGKDIIDPKHKKRLENMEQLKRVKESGSGNIICVQQNRNPVSSLCQVSIPKSENTKVNKLNPGFEGSRNLTSIIIPENQPQINLSNRLSTSELATQQNKRVQQIFKTNYDNPKDRERLHSVIARFKPEQPPSLQKRDFKGFCKKQKKCLWSSKE